ncbi:unnamed protein product [Scytosiphon promiscuus]
MAGGGIIAQTLGTLGLLEVWAFIGFVLGGVVLNEFERVILNSLVLFEAIGRTPGMIAACFILNDNSSSEVSDDVKTLTRDQLHNMVYPRSPPRSRVRRDFAAMAWYSVWIASVPIVLLLTFYPVWSLSSEDEPLWVRLVPSMLAVLAVILCVAGYVAMDSNQSCFVITVTYTTTKVISVFVILHAADRLLFGEDSEEGAKIDLVDALGILLLCLQVIKIGSGCVAAVQYIRGRPDEKLPKLQGALRLCCFATA